MHNLEGIKDTFFFKKWIFNGKSYSTALCINIWYKKWNEVSIDRSSSCFSMNYKNSQVSLFILCIFRSGCIASHLLRQFVTHQFLDPFTLMFWFMFPQSLIGSELWGACFSLSGLISLSPSHIQNSLSSCLHSFSCWGQCSFLWKLSPRSIVTCQDAFQQTPVRLCHVCLSKMGSSRVQFLHSAQFCSESKNPTMIHCYSSIFCHFGSVSGFCPYTETLGRVPWTLQNWQ